MFFDAVKVEEIAEWTRVSFLIRQEALKDRVIQEVRARALLS